MQEKIVILPCNGVCATGKITWIAAQELVLEGKAEWYSPLCGSDSDTEFKNKDSHSFIIVDGCESKCLFNAYLEKGLAGKHQLSLSDIGIDTLYLDDIKRDDIELAKGAIVVECAEADTLRHLPLLGCCCR